MTLRQREPRMKSPRYLRELPKEGRAECEACGKRDGTTVAAHVRWGTASGMGAKPHDWAVCALCAGCHAEQEANPGPEFWHKVFLRMLQRRFLRWERVRNLENTP
jgi:hypothetical protein